MLDIMKELLEGIYSKFYWHNLVAKGRRMSLRAPKEPMTEPIDFVVTWVDGSDPAWREEKERYEKQFGLACDKHSSGEKRYRDWDLFQYWFRAVEKYAPWVRNVYLVTWGHIPQWLNINSPKLKVVKHSDFIPDSFLPTFNSNAIELNLHRIEGLSEYFVYFNDDMFLGCPVKPEDFFRGGKPSCTAIAYPLQNEFNSTFDHIMFTAQGIINTKYRGSVSKRITEHPELWFSTEYRNMDTYNLLSAKYNWLPGMLCTHLPAPFRRSDFQSAWEIWPELMENTSFNKFRTAQDTTHFMVTLYCIMEGRFNAVSMEHHGYHFWNPPKQSQEIRDAISQKKYHAICINDSPSVSYEDFLRLKQEIHMTMDLTFPEKSSFER